MALFHEIYDVFQKVGAIFILDGHKGIVVSAEYLDCGVKMAENDMTKSLEEVDFKEYPIKEMDRNMKIQVVVQMVLALSGMFEQYTLESEKLHPLAKHYEKLAKIAAENYTISLEDMLFGPPEEA
jgi:hypothetical protein